MISPEATEGLNGRVELVPAGTEVPITVRLVALAGSTANGGQLDFQIATRTLGLSRDGQLISQSIFRRIDWPGAGIVLLAANASLSFATSCGYPYSLSIAEFRERAAVLAAAPAASATTLTRA